MNKEINRRLTFNTPEVRNALITHLKSINQPYPEVSSDASLKLNEDGATLEWTEECDIKL